jgi:hypothetical protein
MKFKRLFQEVFYPTLKIHYVILLNWSIYTTPLNSFTDELIPSATGMKSVGEIITDGRVSSV